MNRSPLLSLVPLDSTEAALCHSARLRLLAVALRCGLTWIQVQRDDLSLGGIPRIHPSDSLWASAVEYAQNPSPETARYLLAEARRAPEDHLDPLYSAAREYRAARFPAKEEQ